MVSREGFADGIGSSWRSWSNQIWDTQINKVKETIPDFFPLNYAEEGLVNLFNGVKTVIGELAYSTGKTLGYAIWDMADSKIVDLDKKLQGLLSEAKVKLEAKITAFEKTLSDANKKLNDTIITYNSKFAGLDKDILDIQSLSSSLDSKLRGINSDLLKFNDRIDFVNKALSGLEMKLSGYDSRFTGLDKKIIDTEAYTTKIRDWADSELKKIKDRISVLESGKRESDQSYLDLNNILTRIRERLGIEDR